MQDLIRPDASFTPRELFARMRGAWFEPRLGYMWQENTGATPTTTGGQTVGKLVDLTAARVASQSTAANRPIYQLDSKSLPYLAHDSTDSLSVALPDLGGGVFSSSGSVYFGVPQGMSALHNQSMGTAYTLPALNSEIYGWCVFPERLTTREEAQLERYFLRLAGISGGPDYFFQEDYGPEIITGDSNHFTDGVGNWLAQPNIALSVDAGRLKVTLLTAGPSSNGAQLPVSGLTIGKQYKIQFDFTQGNRGTNNVYVSAFAGMPGYGAFTTDQTVTILFVATATSGNFAIRNDGSGQQENDCWFIDNVSIREFLDGMVGQLTDDAGELLLRG